MRTPDELEGLAKTWAYPVSDPDVTRDIQETATTLLRDYFRFADNYAIEKFLKVFSEPFPYAWNTYMQGARTHEDLIRARLKMGTYVDRQARHIRTFMSNFNPKTS